MTTIVALPPARIPPKVKRGRGLEGRFQNINFRQTRAPRGMTNAVDRHYSQWRPDMPIQPGAQFARHPYVSESIAG